MTLRWRLTIFYTSLIAVLLAAVFTTVYYLVRSSLVDATNREINSGLTQVLRATQVSSTAVPSESDWDAFSADLYAQVEVYINTAPRREGDFNQLGSTASRSVGMRGPLNGNLSLSPVGYASLIRNGSYRGEGVLRAGESTYPVEIAVQALPAVTVDSGSGITVTVYPFVTSLKISPLTSSSSACWRSG